MKHIIIILTLLISLIPLNGYSQHEHPAPQEKNEQEQPVRFETGITLQQLEMLALQNNPTVAQAQATLRGAQGRLKQAGLFPNPTVGYMAEELAWRSPGDTSEHMFFVEQNFLLGGKLGKREDVFQTEVQQAEILNEAQRTILLNAVRAMYYQVLGAQYQILVRKRLADLGSEAVQTTSELLNVGAADQPDYLEAEIEAEASQLALQEAENEREHLWRGLVAIAGQPDLQLQNVAGELNLSNLPDLDREKLISDLLERSAQARTAQVRLQRAEAGVRLAKSGQIPDLNVRGGFGYNYEPFELTKDPIGWESFFEVGITLPIFNRNQGNIAVAEAAVERAKQDLTRIRLLLTSRFADTFAQYTNERTKAERYEKKLLPRARKAYQLYFNSFQQMAAAYPQVLISKRSLDQLEVEYVNTMTKASFLATQLQGSLLGVEALTAPGFSLAEEDFASRSEEASAEVAPETLLPGHEN